MNSKIRSVMFIFKNYDIYVSKNVKKIETVNTDSERSINSFEIE